MYIKHTWALIKHHLRHMVYHIYITFGSEWGIIKVSFLIKGKFIRHFKKVLTKEADGLHCIHTIPIAFLFLWQLKNI